MNNENCWCSLSFKSRETVGVLYASAELYRKDLLFIDGFKSVGKEGEREGESEAVGIVN